jgi:hypothetical protein
MTSLLFLPPLLFSFGIIISSIMDYHGSCPGIMDIPAYSCSIWEYIGRNTISPFAFAAHLIVWIGWGFFSLLLGGLWFFVRALRR